jgi:hypothetical protein
MKKGPDLSVRAFSAAELRRQGLARGVKVKAALYVPGE